MRIATWNVNSIRARADRVVDWLVREDVDVLAMQEIKCRDDQFPHEKFAAAGYEVHVHGLNQWNGVAIASRLPVDHVERGFEGAPGFGPLGKLNTGVDPDGKALEARAMSAQIDGVNVWSLYVPNGRSLDHEHYAYKLRWLQALRERTGAWLTENPELELALTGDWNVAPLDADMGDPSFGPGSTHISEAERTAFNAFLDEGLLQDVVRPIVPEGFTFWDYTQLRFPRNEGMRIDFILGSRAFADRVADASIHREERKGDGPSDHVPVLVDLASADEDDDRPMIFG